MSFKSTSISDEASLAKQDSFEMSPAKLFATSFAEALVPADQLTSMIAVQQRMLARFERTNALLSTANDVSNRRLLPPGAPQQMLSFNSGLLDRIPNTDVVQDFRRATVQLGELRERLISVTRRIRNLKSKCTRLYPEAFGECERSLGLCAYNSPNNIAGSAGDDDKSLEKTEVEKPPSTEEDAKDPPNESNC